jgi:hypothetical protein
LVKTSIGKMLLFTIGRLFRLSRLLRYLFIPIFFDMQRSIILTWMNFILTARAIQVGIQKDTRELSDPSLLSRCHFL